jgi:hypothetical protein
MSVVEVQSGDTGVLSIASGSPGTVLPGNTTIGNCVVLNVNVVGAIANDVTSIASSIGTFVHVTSGAAGGKDFEQWVCISATGAAATVTITTGDAARCVTAAFEFSGVASVTVGPSNSGVGTTATSGAINVPAVGGAVVFSSPWGVTSSSPASPWVDYSANDFNYQPAYVLSSGAQTATWTIGSQSWGTCSVIFNPPSVVVTAPTRTITSAYPVVTWTETLGAGASQTAYEVIVEFGNYGTVPGQGATAWDSGVVASASLTATCAIALQPNTYRVFVQITETGGATSSWSYSTTTILGTISEVPGTYDVAIGGHGYMIDTTFEFGRRDSFRHSSIPAQRDATDITNQPGEATINPQGLWRSEFNDWSMGSGQLFADRKDSVPNRYHHSQGVDAFTNKWYASLLPDTTQLIADTDTTCQVLVVNGYVFKLNASGVKYSTDGATYTAITGLSGTPVMMCSDGATVYIACGTGGVYTAVGGTVAAVAHLVNVTSQNVYFVAFCSNVLLVANGPSLYQVSTSITSWPTALITQAQATWTWNCACGGNGWIYIGGFAGAVGGSASLSSVFKTQFASDGTTLGAPAIATPLPPGEIVYSLFAFVNYILMGTSLGMRFCQTLGLIDPSGQDTGLLKIGPIIPNLQELTTKPVRCFTANQRFVYFGWSNYSASSVLATDTCTGLGWLDIANFTGDQTPAYSSNLMISGAGEITSLDWFNGAPIFTVSGKGVYTAASTYVASGNIYSGYIGFRIPDQKILIAYSVDTTSVSGSVTASINQDDETNYSLGTNTGATNLFSVPQIYGELFETDLTLNATSSNTVPTTVRRATLQSFPAITAGKFIITALRFWDQIETKAGRRQMNVYSELAFMENLRQNQSVVTYQEGTNTWSVVVDEIDFVEYEPSSLPTGGFIGICMVTLKTASSGLLT